MGFKRFLNFLSKFVIIGIVVLYITTLSNAGNIHQNQETKLEIGENVVPKNGLEKLIRSKRHFGVHYEEAIRKHWQNALGVPDPELTKLNERIDQLNTKVFNLNTEKDNIQYQLTKANKNVASSNLKITSLKADLLKKTEENDQVKTKLETVTKENEELKHKIDNMNTIQDEIDAIKNNLMKNTQAEMDKIDYDMEEVKNKLNKTILDEANLRNEVNGLKVTFFQTMVEVNKMNEADEKLKKQLIDGEDLDRNATTVEINNLKAKLDEANFELATNKKVIGLLDAKIFEIANEKIELKDELEQLKEQKLKLKYIIDKYHDSDTEKFINLVIENRNEDKDSSSLYKDVVAILISCHYDKSEKNEKSEK